MVSLVEHNFQGDIGLRSSRTFSMAFRQSSNGFLSLTSFPAAQVLSWSRFRWSFLICVFKLSSSFSFCA